MKSRNFNPSVHGLRGFAALSIVIFHIWAGALDDDFLPQNIPSWISHAVTSLSAGVEIFFMISGYLITASIVKYKNIRLFFKHRCIRIYPAFLPIILIIFIFGPFIGYDYFNEVTSIGEWIKLLFANILFLPGLFPIDAALLVAWTLSYEAGFYIFCALSYLLYEKADKKISKILIVIATIACCIIYPKATFFAVGAIVFWIQSRVRNDHFLLKDCSIVYLFAFLGGLFVLSSHKVSLGFISQSTFIVFTYISAMLLFLSIVKEWGIFSSLMRLPAFQFIGTISYSLYLWHTPIMFVTKRLSIKLLSSYGDTAIMIAFSASSMVISFVAAYVSYILFEKMASRSLMGLTNGQ